MDEIGKSQDKLRNEASVSSISTDWSIQSISLKSDLPILAIVDKLIPIFFDWPLQVYSLRFQVRIRLVNARSTCHIDDHKELVEDLSQSENERYFEWILNVL